jgi:hypothetical protein
VKLKLGGIVLFCLWVRSLLVALCSVLRCYIVLVLYTFLIKISNIYVIIIIHVDTSELPVMLQKCMGHWKVTAEMMTLWKIECIYCGSNDLDWSSGDIIPPSPNAMELSWLYILQIPNTHRPDLSNKSQFIPTGLFYEGKPLSSDISHASTLRSFSSDIDRLTVGPTQPSVQWVLGALSPGVKWQGREADHSPPSSAEVNNGGTIPPLPSMSSWHSA